MSMPALVQGPPVDTRDRVAAVHHLRARSGDRAVQGRRGRLVSGAERAPGRAARRVAGADHRRACRVRQGASGAAVGAVAVNQIVHKSNNRLDHDLAMCEKYKVPMMITSLGAREELNQAAHGWGGIVFHDVINQKFAHKAIEKGADGLILVAAGAGGHAGTISPLRLRRRRRAPGSTDRSRCRAPSPTAARSAPRAFSAPTSPISARPSSRPRKPTRSKAYKEMITSSSAEDIVYSNLFTGVHGNYLKPSIVKAGLDPDESADLRSLQDELWHRCLRRARKPKAWKEIWGSGQGIGSIGKVVAGRRTDRALQEGI